jgi:predicted RNase H-like HicB family nuclease
MREYTVIYERAGGNYSAYVPDLPGCITTGLTLETTKRNIRDAIELYLDALKEDGRPAPDAFTTAGPILVAA